MPKPKKKPVKAPPKATNKPFLVMNMDKNARIGSHMIIMHVAESYKKAESFVERIQGSTPELVCILEKKSVLSRQPKITISPLGRDIINP